MVELKRATCAVARHSTYDYYTPGTVYDGSVPHTSLGRFSELACPATKRVPRPNEHTSSKSSRQGVSSAAFSVPILFQLWTCQAWKIGPGVCCIHRRTRQVTSTRSRVVVTPCNTAHRTTARQCQVHTTQQQYLVYEKRVAHETLRRQDDDEPEKYLLVEIGSATTASTLPGATIDAQNCR